LEKDFSEIKIDEDVHGIGTISFSMESTIPSFLFIQEFAKIELFLAKNGEDISIFSGYISDIEYDFFTAKISGKCEKHWLKNKILYSQKEYTNAISPTVFQQILDEANARMPTHEMPLSFYSTVSTVFSEKWEKGTTYFDLIDAMAIATKSEWRAKYGKIFFQEKIGEKKEFTLLSLKNSPNIENLFSVAYERKSQEISNALIGKTETGYFEAVEILDQDLPRIEKFLSLEKGSTQSTLDNELLERKMKRKILKVKPTVADFSLVLGDEVGVKIEQGSDIFDFSGTARIMTREIEFPFGIPEISLGLSDLSRPIASSKNVLANFEKRIAKLEK
jgi:hypothetical protein